METTIIEVANGAFQSDESGADRDVRSFLVNAAKSTIDPRNGDIQDPDRGIVLPTIGSLHPYNTGLTARNITVSRVIGLHSDAEPTKAWCRVDVEYSNERLYVPPPPPPPDPDDRRYSVVPQTEYATIPAIINRKVTAPDGSLQTVKEVVEVNILETRARFTVRLTIDAGELTLDDINAILIQNNRIHKLPFSVQGNDTFLFEAGIVSQESENKYTLEYAWHSDPGTVDLPQGDGKTWEIPPSDAQGSGFYRLPYHRITIVAEEDSTDPSKKIYKSRNVRVYHNDYSGWQTLPESDRLFT